MKVLGIDIGTTTISLVVLDPDRKKVWESRTIFNGTFIETAREWERSQEKSGVAGDLLRYVWSRAHTGGLQGRSCLRSSCEQHIEKVKNCRLAGEEMLSARRFFAAVKSALNLCGIFIIMIDTVCHFL